MSMSGRVRGGFAWFGLLVAPILLGAQSEAWTAYAEGWRKVPHAPLTLLHPRSLSTLKHRAGDEVFLRLTAAADVALEPLEGPALDRVQTARGWSQGGPHWILLDRDGNALMEGTKLPSGEALRDQVIAQGRVPTWEALDQFLRIHPDSGSALRRRLRIAFRMSTTRFRALREEGKAEGLTLSTQSRWPAFRPAVLKAPESAAGISREVVDTLHRLNRLPDPWRTDCMALAFWLTSAGSMDAAALQPELDPFREEVFGAWRTNPHAGSSLAPTPDSAGLEWLGGLWIACHLRDETPLSLDRWSQVVPAPGRVWPSPGLLDSLAIKAFEGQRLTALLTFLNGLPADPPGAANRPDAWPEWLALRRGVTMWQAVALAELDRWTEAALALEACRQVSGPGWREQAASMKAIYTAGWDQTSDGKSSIGKRAVPPAAFLACFDRPPIEPPSPPPPVEPLRFLAWGKPGWLLLRAAADLAPWSPSELREESPSERDADRLRSAGLPAQGWAVFRGAGEVVCRGDGAPVPAHLALQMQGVAPSRIHILDAFLKKHPDHLDARRERYLLVRSRMPSPFLEGRLVEDAAEATIPLDFGPDAAWISNLDAWRTRARALVPGLEAGLRRWPEDQSLWRAWISWSAFLPSPPSVVALADGLPVFGVRAAWKTQLPAQVHHAVASEFRGQRRLEAMADWFGEAWREVVQRGIEAGPEGPGVSESDQAIHEGYREALTALRRTEDLAELDQRWRSMASKGRS